MADNLNKVIHTSQDTFDEIVAGTKEGYEYDSKNLYTVKLGDPVVLGATGSGTYINENNELTMNIKVRDLG